MTTRRRIASIAFITLWFAGWGESTPVAAQRGEPDAAEEAAPWEGATDVTLPPFLQDTDRRIVDPLQGPRLLRSPRRRPAL